jgi:hypothetical protein
MRNCALPKKFHVFSCGIMLTPRRIAGSKKQSVPRMSSLKNRLGAQSCGDSAGRGGPPRLVMTPMPPVAMRPGLLFGEMPKKPISGRYDVFEKFRSTWSSDFCSLYCADRKAFQPSFARSPKPALPLACH